MWGRRGALVKRNGRPLEDTPYQPDVTVKDITELVDALL